jgi:pimeloyl-ACP methyl ester carboxylesterase
MANNFRFFILLALISATATAQPTVNNLVHTPGYPAAPWGQLGNVKISGNGPRKVILIPGWGFDPSIFNDFVKSNSAAYTFYAVTIPGFGNTSAPAMPNDTGKFGDLFWTRGVIKGISDLIDKEKLIRPDIITCFTYSEMIAMRFALDHPDKVGKVIIISGMAKYTSNLPSLEPRTLASRTYFIENMLAKNWFKTVTTDVWNKGNFSPATFCVDSAKAKKHWDMMSAVPIPVMVRYICEYYCTDISLEYKDLKVPVLVIVPGFTAKVLSENNYLGPFFHYSWLGAMPATDMIHVVAVTDTRAFIMDDQPKKLNELVKEFLENGAKSIGPMK